MKFKDLRWLLIIGFFILSIINVWFGLFGLICMGSPIVLSLLGHGKKHCQSHCPMGHSAALITTAQKNSNSDKIFTPKRKKSA